MYYKEAEPSADVLVALKRFPRYVFEAGMVSGFLRWVNITARHEVAKFQSLGSNLLGLNPRHTPIKSVTLGEVRMPSLRLILFVRNSLR